MKLLIMFALIVSFILSIQFLALSIKYFLQENVSSVNYILTSIASFLFMLWFLILLSLYLK